MGPCMSTKNINSQSKKIENKNSININKLPQNEKVILQCKKCRDDIKSYIKKLERTSKSKKEKAKELLKNKEKDRAKLYLKQSKFHSEQAKIADAQLTMVEEQINRLESTTQMLEIQKVLEKGNDVLKKMQEEMNVEKWEKIKDDMDDLKEQQNEINQFFRDNDINVEDIDNDVNEVFNKMEKELGLSDELPKAHDGEIVIDNIKEGKKEKEEKKEALAA